MCKKLDLLILVLISVVLASCQSVPNSKPQVAAKKFSARRNNVVQQQVKRIKPESDWKN
ncbi:MAG TPA: hypothetical protein VM432_07235 [Bdellovibrionales bacterium]|nr:hypothetical protein [Bdellovibrionales bacterium]